MDYVTPEGMMTITLSGLFGILVLFNIIHILYYLGLISYEQTLPSIQPTLILISVTALFTSLNIYALLKIIRLIIGRDIITEEDALFILAFGVLLMEIIYMVSFAKIPLPEITLTIGKYLLIALGAQVIGVAGLILVASIIG